MAKQDKPLDVIIIGAGLAGFWPPEYYAKNTTSKYTSDHLHQSRLAFQHRADLRGEFLRLATEDTGISGTPGRPAEVLWDQKVIDIDAEEGRITLASGEQVEADLVLAADGIKSMVRPHIVGDAAFQTARPSGLSAFRFTLELDDIKAALKQTPEILQANQPTCLSMVYSFDNSMRSVVMYPCRNFGLLNFVCIVPDSSLKEKTTESWTASGDKAELISLFSDFPSWVHDYLRIANSGSFETKTRYRPTLAAGQF
ncbi:salicylate hydroxylase [Fusarium phyllophilum]|uniref:Salicylate hydroxylase n=1 Tax=Fusarium phyllophilum TaxID=47803 RepID=A0A8H5K5M6_9HYPO|nr:salicylate hydroxylase [Fusarium phyllophilum]